MQAYLTNIVITLRLMARDRAVIFFGYVFPLIFFFLFAQMMEAGQGGGVAKQVVTSVLIFGVLGNGFFGAGMRAVSDREQNILRRFKVAPTTAAPLLVSWLVTGWINYIPSALFLICIGHFGYQMPWPERPFTLFIFLSVAVLAFRAIGLIVASIVNSMQETQMVVQLFYLPMLFLSGATFPVSIMPGWLQIVAQFVPSAHLFAGLQGILLRQEGLDAQWKSLAALVLTMITGMFISVKLFRWEKEEKVKPAAKLWVLAALAPFVVLGIYQAYSKESITHAKVLQRELRRSRTLLIRDVRLFIGDGRVVERGALLVREGKIAQVFEGASPDAKLLSAEAIEGSGKTLLPGLIDANVQLTAPGGVADPETLRDAGTFLEWSHAAYLFSGVTSIQSVGDATGPVTRLRGRVGRGERLGSEIFFTGPQFAQPEPRDQAMAMAGELARQGASALFIDPLRLPAPMIEALRSAKLPILSASAAPAASAVLGTDSAPANGYWIPTLTALEASAAPLPELLDRSLVQQTAPKGMLDRTRPLIGGVPPAESRLTARMTNIPQAAAKIVAGSGAGQRFVIHGPGVHREMQLLVRAGLSPNEALRAATGRAAAALGAGQRIGLLKAGMEADLLLVDGNPLREIMDTERISMVIFRGEKINRGGLFEQDKE